MQDHREEFFKFNHCQYSECIFNRKKYCCCKKEEMQYNIDRSCGRYIRKGDAQIPDVIAELIEEDLVLPTSLLLNRGGSYQGKYEQIHNIDFYEHYVVVDYGRNKIRTTIYNDDIINYLMAQREKVAKKVDENNFYCL